MAANLKFTDDEYQVMHNGAFFIHKRTITDKLVNHFGELNNEIETLISGFANLLPLEIAISKGKINKGENYEHLPYILLDSPRIFNLENVFAFRTMFRWGNYFSCTVQLGGSYMEIFRPQIKNFILENKNNLYYIGTSDDEWQHHFRTDNYTLTTDLVNDISRLDSITNKTFFKVAIQISLKKYADLNAVAITFYRTFLDSYVAAIASQKN